MALKEASLLSFMRSFNGQHLSRSSKTRGCADLDQPHSQAAAAPMLPSMHPPCQHSVRTLRPSSQVRPCLSRFEHRGSTACGQESCLIAYLACTQVLHGCSPLLSVHKSMTKSLMVCFGLAGLPEDDDAVQLARLAQASGNTLESVLQFEYKALSCKEADAGAGPDPDRYQDVRR